MLLTRSDCKAWNSKHPGWNPAWVDVFYSSFNKFVVLHPRRTTFVLSQYNLVEIHGTWQYHGQSTDPASWCQVPQDPLRSSLSIKTNTASGRFYDFYGRSVSVPPVGLTLIVNVMDETQKSEPSSLSLASVAITFLCWTQLVIAATSNQNQFDTFFLPQQDSKFHHKWDNLCRRSLYFTSSRSVSV